MKSLVVGLPESGTGVGIALLAPSLESAEEPVKRIVSGAITCEEASRVALELEHLGARLHAIEDRLEACESPSSDPLVIELQPWIEKLSDDAREVFMEIGDFYEDGGKIGDLAFCALLELRTRRERFSHGAAVLTGPALAAEAGALLHNLKRALTAVQTALCAAWGLEPTLDLTRELGVALAVRAAYAKFRRDIEEIARVCRPEDGDAGPALNSAATSIAKLTGRDIFRKLRPQDRFQVYALQERIRAWRTAETPDRDLASRLWQDLYNCAQLLTLVNRRQELVEHDRRVLEEIEDAVAQAPSAEAVRGRLIEEASRLAGRDSAFDALLRGTPEAEELLAALRSLKIGCVEPPVALEQEM